MRARAASSGVDRDGRNIEAQGNIRVGRPFGELNLCAERPCNRYGRLNDRGRRGNRSSWTGANERLFTDIVQRKVGR